MCDWSSVAFSWKSTYNGTYLLSPLFHILGLLMQRCSDQNGAPRGFTRGARTRDARSTGDVASGHACENVEYNVEKV